MENQVEKFPGNVISLDTRRGIKNWIYERMEKIRKKNRKSQKNHLIEADAQNWINDWTKIDSLKANKPNKLSPATQIEGQMSNRVLKLSKNRTINRFSLSGFHIK